ncbi:MAG TPA: phosphoribosyltransferase family protein [Thermoanaerobaculia bacterium]|jgi:hypoxanthine phosphoribosyltransferase|nr:phosphoribosyltransferase family protein [Thermoanaerobaculia bacterium]
MTVDIPQAGIEILFEEAEVRDSVTALGRRIATELGPEDPLLIALLGGSVIFLADLVRAIEQPVRYGLIDVAYRADLAESPEGEEAAEVMRIEYPIPIEIGGQSVLVLKDVVSSGVTEPYLEQQLRDHGAQEVRFAALIDMPDERKTAFNLHYSALTTHRKGLLVGYGLKHEGRYGNLPYVGRLGNGAA